MSPPVTRRKALLISAGAMGVAGAVTGAADSAPRATTGTRNSPSRTETATPVDDPGETLYRVRVVDHGIKDVERAENLEFSVRLADPEIAERATARVVLERENTGEETIEVGTDPASGAQPQYSSVVGEPELGIVLVPARNYDLEAPEPGCWTPDTDGLTVLSHPGTMGLDPGESVAVEYEVWAEPTEGRRCLQPGTYSFEEMLVRWTLRIAAV